ncbi:ubiquinol oxidase subunit II [Thalassospira lucentensis]|uniref:ubiquinol oxidase subunit II n=1 Tax=Thalassospira lucentensis TaxID=168935 RepID=UPI00142E3A0F|nr:ubiquinol oxidase subunit II [Thalassospira lucentensis]NIZ03037.1 ubiquinol oxidase subunit II [Thalassospira lucentensis]
MLSKLARGVAIASVVTLLAGCNLVVMDPSGDIASQQADLIVVSTILMLLIIVPVMALVVFFAWKYRQSNKDAEYDPEWHHSTKLEIVIWSAPLAIIIALGAITWVSTHTLDPYRPLDRIDAERPLAKDHEPMVVEVVSLDWKWLFFYPEQGIATVNELAVPIDTPIRFKITSSGVMNTFYVPAMAGMIYSMAGMETQLNAVMNEEGVYDGFSANYSGEGFSHMRFKLHTLSDEGFADWAAKVKSEGSDLSRSAYMELEKPSIDEPVRYYGDVDSDLYAAILNMCVDQSKMCMNEMMAIDENGGGGLAGIYNVMSLTYDTPRERGSQFLPSSKSYVATLCTAPTGGLSQQISSIPLFENGMADDRFSPVPESASIGF